MQRRIIVLLAILVIAIATYTIYAASKKPSLTIYSGRSEELISPVIDKFAEAEGIDVEVKYGDSIELANLINTEGDQSPADIFVAQDLLAMNRVSQAGLLASLPKNVTDLSLSSEIEDDYWVGVTARFRTIVYDSRNYQEEDLSDDIFEYCKAKYEGKVGWAPLNASFQDFLGELIAEEGIEVAEAWVKCMVENNTKSYPKNTPIVQAVINNEINLGFVNHYYLEEFLEEDDSITAKNYFPEGILGMSNMSTVGMINSSQQSELAQKFIKFMLNQESQEFFQQYDHEIPLAKASAEENDYEIIKLEATDKELQDAIDLLNKYELL